MDNEEERMRHLYDAALKGCVSTLNRLLQQDPLILHRVSSQTTFFETPLHKSALLGHLEFTKTLLAHYPKLALELDSFGSTPLHLASAQGHIDIVKELLKPCGEACFFRDQEHRIPLHYAVIRGRRDVVLELIRAKPESLTFHDDKGKNILHLCVMYNHLEILKELEAFTHYDTNNLLIEGDSDCNNTILHLAIMLKQVETVRYLMSIPKIRSEALNLKNNMGYSATDIVAQIPKDSKSLEMQVILMEFGIKCEKNESWWQKQVFNRIDKWLVYNGEQLEEMRGNICTVASVISTISFQAALNPPGSVIQQNILSSNSSDSSFYTFSQGPFGCLPWFTDIVDGKNHTKGPCPGKAMSSYIDPKAFKFFQLSNTISFLASVWIALLLVLGVPLNRRFVSWMVSQGMGLSISCLISSYLLGVQFVSPIEHYQYKAAIITTICFVNGLHALVGIYVSVKLVMEAVKKKPNKQVKVHTSP